MINPNQIPTPMATKTIDSIKFLQKIGNSVRSDDRNGCALIATAVVSGLPYSEVYDMYKRLGRKHGRGTPLVACRRVMERIGATRLREYTISGLVSKPGGKNPTVLQFSKQNPVGTFFLLVRGHALAVVDGKIYDNLTTKRARIYEAWRVK